MKNLLFFLLLCLPLILAAQDDPLFETLNFKNAVENGTRTRNGNPGPDYWQNHSDYKISVRLDTAEKKIYGYEEITYHNNSPDSLMALVIRLYKNRYKKGAIRNVEIAPGNIHDGVELDTLFINNSDFVVPGKDRRTITFGTNLIVILREPVVPGDDLQLKCKWNYRVPVHQDDRRVGYFKDNIWFIGYFYPQIAVYDDLENFGLKGWDLRLRHYGAQEFYNDFNNYDVSIEVPEGFYVWSTGTLQNANEIYSRDLLERLEQARMQDTIINLLTEQDVKKDHVVGNIWKYRADGVPDFAFGTAPEFIWDASSVQLGDRRVTVDAVYHPESDYFRMAIDQARKTVAYASGVKPGIAFPWDHVTVFNGKSGGGMEFPMIVNDAEFSDSTATSYVTFHEVFHNYTPFMMGLNEKRYPFMDEGFTDFFSTEYMLDTYGTNFYFAPSSQSRIDDYNIFAKNEDEPLISSYIQGDEISLSYYYYVKPYVVYSLFREMVGEERFMAGFKEFVTRWKGKHPTPYDFFYTMNDALGENFNWFWKSWFFDYGYADLGLSLDINNESVLVQRVGASLPVPVKLNITYVDGSEKLIKRSMDVWKYGDQSIAIKLDNLSEIERISLDTITVPDVDHSNNSIIL